MGIEPEKRLPEPATKEEIEELASKGHRKVVDGVRIFGTTPEALEAAERSAVESGGQPTRRRPHEKRRPLSPKEEPGSGDISELESPRNMRTIQEDES